MRVTLTIFAGCLLAVVYSAPPNNSNSARRNISLPPVNSNSKCKKTCKSPGQACARESECRPTPKYNCYLCIDLDTINRGSLPKNVPNPTDLAAMIAKKAASAAATAAAMTNSQNQRSNTFQNTQPQIQQKPMHNNEPFDFFGGMFPGPGANQFQNLLGWQMMMGDQFLPFN